MGESPQLHLNVITDGGQPACSREGRQDYRFMDAANSDGDYGYRLYAAPLPVGQLKIFNLPFSGPNHQSMHFVKRELIEEIG